MNKDYIRVAVRPVKSLNAFTTYFAKSIRQGRFLVAELNELKTYPFRSEIVLLHWPDEFFRKVSRRARVRRWIFLINATLSRCLFGQKVVWAVHNLVPHDSSSLKSTQIMRSFFSCLGGLIFFSQESRKVFTEVYPELSLVPFVITKHGRYPGPDLEFSPAHNAPGTPIKCALVGYIRPYKSPMSLASAAAALGKDAVSLTIAGLCANKQLAYDLSCVSSSTDNILFINEQLSEVRFTEIIDESDAIVIPYQSILNSGSAVHALSRYRRVIAPRFPTLVELQSAVGSDWVHLYDGSMSPDTLRKALVWAHNAPKSEPDLSQFEWEGIGSQLRDFLETVAR